MVWKCTWDTRKTFFAIEMQGFHRQKSLVLKEPMKPSHQCQRLSRENFIQSKSYLQCLLTWIPNNKIFFVCRNEKQLAINVYEKFLNKGLSQPQAFKEASKSLDIPVARIQEFCTEKTRTGTLTDNPSKRHKKNTFEKLDDLQRNIIRRTVCGLKLTACIFLDLIFGLALRFWHWSMYFYGHQSQFCLCYSGPQHDQTMSRKWIWHRLWQLEISIAGINSEGPGRHWRSSGNVHDNIRDGFEVSQFQVRRS